MTPREEHLTRWNEGERLYPYVDTVGKVTIGVGHNLTDRGIPKDVSDLLLEMDYAEVEVEVEEAFPWSTDLDPVRLAALRDLVFNMGITKVKKFKTTLRHLEAGEWEKAGNALIHSKWYGQVRKRGPRIVQMVKTGRWPWDASDT